MEKSLIKTAFPKYPAYKDSGVEWLGQIPEGWKISRLRNVFSFSKGLTITKENLQEKGVYCVNYGEIHSKFGFEVNPEIHDLKCVSEEYLLSDFNSLLNKGDFVFADTSEDIEGSGNFTYLNSKIRTFAGYHTVIARLQIPINERFAAYIITSQSFRNQIRRRVKGVKVFSITQSLLKTASFWYPLEKEQTAIATFLDDKTSKIDRAIAQKEKMIALLKERKQIIIQNAVTKGLDPNVKLKDSGVEWIGEIPEHWEVKKVKHVSNVVLGKMICNQNLGSMELKPYLKSKNIQWLKVDVSSVDEMWFTKQEMEQYRLKKEDLVLSEGGEVGKTCIWNNELSECYIQNSAHKVTLNLDCNPFFYLYLFNHIGKQGGFDSIINRVSIGHLTKDKLLNIEVVKPQLQEQTAIVAHIETQSAKIDQAISLQQTQIEKLKEYKASLIDSAVTGKIKVQEA